MATSFVDSAVVVDILRVHPPAQLWYGKQIQLGITPILWMEVVNGAPNKIKQLRAIKFLTTFEMVYLTKSDLDWAMQQMFAYRLSHNVGMNDCLIASVNQRLQLPLWTTNLKHFTPLLGSLAQKPY